MSIISQKNRLMVSLFFLATFIYLLYPLSAISAEKWWEKKDEGWFFYNEKPLVEEPMQATPLLLPNTPADSQTPLFSEAMKKQGEELLSKALENPTLENVKAYMEHNRKMLALSKDFSFVWQRVLMNHPELVSGTPLSDSDKDIYFKQATIGKKEALERLSEQAGLLFIYDTTCPYCLRQAKYLKMFSDEHPSFIVKAVTMNGEVLPEFPGTVKDNGISVRLNVVEHPAIFLMYPPDRFERVATGLVTPDELKEKLLLLQLQDSLPNREEPFGNPDLKEAKGEIPLFLTGQ